MTFPLPHFKTFPAIAWCIALAGLNCALPAAAESPMHTDDAGTLAQGTMKLEAVAFRDDKTRGVDLVVGAGVLPGLEMEAVLGRAKDRQYEPATTYRGPGLWAEMGAFAKRHRLVCRRAAGLGTHARAGRCHPPALDRARICLNRPGHLPPCQRASAALERRAQGGEGAGHKPKRSHLGGRLRMAAGAATAGHRRGVR